MPSLTTTDSWIPRPMAALRSFAPSSMPVMVRANYRRELITAALLPFMLAAVETGVVTVLVRKSFDGIVPDRTLNYIVAILGASKAFANVASFIWVKLNHGRDKLAFTLGILWSMAALIALLAVVPRTPVGLILFTALVVAARVVWSGHITIRSTIWQANYSRDIRATITGKTATVQVLAASALGAGMGLAMDYDPRSYRVLLIIGCLIGFVGILSWSRIRVRGHRALIRSELEDDGENQPTLNPIRAMGILFEDKLFGKYMASQFVLGLGNLMIGPLLAIIVKERFELSYFKGMLVTGVIAMALMPVAIPYWSRLLSHWHIVKFRTVHSWVFVGANVLFFLAAWLEVEVLLYVAAGVQGLAFGGGALAWTLGHLDFAPPHRASHYMGVHVSLTGVRGLIAPFLGVAIYEALEGWETGRGAWVFAVCTAFSALGGIGFMILARQMHVAEKEREDPIETPPPSRVG